MDKEKFKKNLLKLKKDKFKKIVERICKKRTLPIPSINFEGCPYEKGNELAHYHPETNTICISEEQLNLQNLDELEETAAHEISHILEQNHGYSFYKEEMTSRIAGFKAPAGVVHITRSHKIEVTKDKKLKIDKTRCNYHLCRKKRKLTQCKYCKGYYCSEHIEPYPPEMYSMEKHSEKKEGHPCGYYAEHLIKKEKEESDKYGEALDRLLRKPKMKAKTTTGGEKEFIDTGEEYEDTEHTKAFKESLSEHREKLAKREEAYNLASELISVIGLIVFALGLILNKNIYLIVWGILMILLGTFWYLRSKRIK